MKKIIASQAKINADFNLKVGLIDNKLAYVGFATDEIQKLFPNFEIVETGLFLNQNSDLWILLSNFVNKIDQPIDLSNFCLRGSEKQILVWKELLNLHYGDQVTYSELAKRAGMPTAVRFVASCVAQNPFLLIVPCHRVVSKNGLVKYRSGKAKKLFLLENHF